MKRMNKEELERNGINNDTEKLYVHKLRGKIPS